MAVAEIRPDWTVGTLTLVGGSKDFTTTGSALETAAIQAGDEIITASGNVLIIADITGQNSGTLMEVCPASAAGTDQPLRIRFQPDGSRYNGATANLVQRLSSGNLYAFSELQGVADGVPVFTGAGTMDVVPKSEFGPTDTHGNLAALAGLSKENNQLIIMGASGDIGKKPISEVTEAIDAKFTFPSGGNINQFVNGTGALAAMNKAAVGLDNVDNTSDSNKPISTATQTALNGKFGTSGGTLAGAVDITSNTNSAVRFFNESSYGYTVYFNSDNGTTDNGLQVVHSNGGLLATFLYNGNFSVIGTISKGGGTFLIDHPLDPLNRNLRHGFVEAPRYDLIYRGKVKLVDGVASVNIDTSSDMTDGTFAALTKNACVTSLQNQDGFARIRPSAISGGVFEIICEDITCTDEVAWVVIAERNDAFVRNIDPNCERGTGRFIPEFDKED